MESANILFVCPFENKQAKAFVDSLAQALTPAKVQIKDAGLATFLFEPSKFEIAHFFLPATASIIRRALRKGPNTKLFQTLFNAAAETAQYRKAIFTNHVLTFSEQERNRIREVMPDRTVDVILPCVAESSFETMEPASTVRQRYDVGDRLLAVALNDFNDQEHFTIFLYTAREYQRRPGYRFIIPLYKQDSDSLRWRKHLQNAVHQENLTATTLLDSPVDHRSLLDAADITLFINKHRDRYFSVPLVAVEALCAGKPLICHNIGALGEIVGDFCKDWLVVSYEDFSRISRDLLKQRDQLEQISTGLAQYARAKMSVETVAAKYKQLYNLH